MLPILTCIQLGSLGEANFYTNSVGCTVVGSQYYPRSRLICNAGSCTSVQISAIVVYYYSNVVTMLRLNCLQLVLLGEDNFYSNTTGYTVMVSCASDLTGRLLHYLYSSCLNATPYALQMLVKSI